jgi:hypothetical protein
MNRLFSLAGYTIGISLLIQCGSSKKDDATVGELEGTWATECMVLEDNSSNKDVATYSNNTSTFTITRYSDSACSDKMSITKITSSFTIGSAGSVGKKIDTTIVSYSLAFSTEAEVEKANTDSLYTYTNWKKDVAQDITGKKSSAENKDPDVTKGEVAYSIFKLDGTKLMLGKRTETEDQKTETKRSTTIDDSMVLTKQ